MPANPTSYVVIGDRAYTLDDDGQIVSAATGDTTVDFDGAQGVIDTRLVTEPSVATPAGKVIDRLREMLRPLGANAAAQPAAGDDDTPFGG